MIVLKSFFLYCRSPELLENYFNRIIILSRRLRTSSQKKMIVFEVNYKKFAKMRGFPTFNDLAYHRRGFIECWTEPGFHRFWQVWNPGIAYFVYCLFIWLGGAKKWVIPTFFSFFICGIIHTALVSPFLGWSYSVICAFSFFGILTIISRKVASILKQQKWPKMVNTIINIALVLGSFDIGFRIDHLLS